MLEKRCPKCNKLIATEEESTCRIPKAIVYCITDIDSIDRDLCKIHIKCPRCKETTVLAV